MSISKQAGITLVELLLFIVIVSIGLAGILSVMNITTLHGADPMVRKQALAAAESLMEEITLKDFSDPDGSEAGETRPSFDDVDDYNGYASSGIKDINENPISALADYQVSVAVTGSALGGIAAGQALLVTVTVSGPGNESITLNGYRTNYAP